MSVTVSDFSLDCAQTGVDCTLTILSSMLGIDNRHLHGNASDMDQKGLTGYVRLFDSSSSKVMDKYTDGGWSHWIGSTGENLNVCYIFGI